MNDPLLALKRIDEILREACYWDRPGQLAAYATIMYLVDRLDHYLEEEELPGWSYLQDHTEKLRWHAGAMFDLDVTNGYGMDHHYSAALGSLGVLETNLDQLKREGKLRGF